LLLLSLWRVCNLRPTQYARRVHPSYTGSEETQAKYPPIVMLRGTSLYTTVALGRIPHEQILCNSKVYLVTSQIVVVYQVLSGFKQLSVSTQCLAAKRK